MYLSILRVLLATLSCSATLQSGSAAGAARLTPIASRDSHVLFTNLLSSQVSLTNQIYLNGGGVALGDIDNDGKVDIYFSATYGNGKLFRNLGNWHFSNVTAQAGLGFSQPSSGVCFADLTGDGSIDLLVNAVGAGTRLFVNDGKGGFAERNDVGFDRRSGASSLAVADTDADGDLDVYVVNYRDQTLRDQPGTRFRMTMSNGVARINSINGRSASDPEMLGRFSVSDRGAILEHGQPDVLYLNDGTGRFTAAAEKFRGDGGESLAGPLYDWGLSAMFYDVNQDGAPDLYVCNDFESPDRFWINDGKGNFRTASPQALRTSSLFSMGIDFSDVNRDGKIDFFVADMLSRYHTNRQVQVGDKVRGMPSTGEGFNRPQAMRNTLQINRGDNTYVELAYFSGTQASEWSWAPVFVDLDLDGYEDLFITTGHERDAQNIDIINGIETTKRSNRMAPADELALRKRFPRLELPNIAFRNSGGISFKETGAAWGFDAVSVAHGMALGDIDGDGDLDFVINNLNAEPTLLRNDATQARLAVKLKGLPPNVGGIGGTIRVMGGAVAEQQQQIIAGGRYLSSDQPIRVFACGSPTNKMTVEVRWRSGKRSLVQNVAANQTIEIAESEATSSASPASETKSAPLFTDQSDLLSHRDEVALGDDFERQPLLVYRTSQDGPAVAWIDVNQDSRDDLFIGGGAGKDLTVFTNIGPNSFSKAEVPSRDQVASSSIVSVPATNGVSSIFIGKQTVDIASTNSIIGLGSLSMGTLPPGLSVGALSVADIDGDGDLDLFAGARAQPGKYPLGSPSVMLVNSNGVLRADDRFRALNVTNIVNGSLFTDLNMDGFPDLVLATEWGSLRILQNNKGRFVDETAKWGVAGLTGLWRGISAGDFDNDGDMDLIASNWGRNHRFAAFTNFQTFSGDFDQNGVYDVVFAFEDTTLGKVVPLQSFEHLTAGLPSVRGLAQTYAAFSRLGVSELIGSGFASASRASVNTFETSIFINDGGRFRVVPLANEAQWSLASGVVVSDFNGDGFEDLFLAQNLFSTHPEISRMDAGRGLLLQGDGRTGFRPVPGQESGLMIYGEQRGAATADFDRDGRDDLVVTQRGAATKLFRNTQGKPGLTVTLAGSPEKNNPQAVGSTLRLSAGDWKGPLREVRVGEGFWSVNSASHILHAPAENKAERKVTVRWPGGKETSSAIPDQARRVRIQMDGSVATIE